MAKEIKTIDISKIQIGEINNATLVDWFGSEANKKTYQNQKAKSVNASMKATLLKRAVCKCDIEDLGRGKYMIHSVHEEEIPYSMYEINKGVVHYMAPMILSELLYTDYIDGETILNLANAIGVINKNYRTIKFHKKQTSKKLDLDIENIHNYYSVVDSAIKYYIIYSLKKLKSCGCLLFDEPYMVITKKTDNIEHTMKSTKIDNITECRIATGAEGARYSELLEEAMDELDIADLKEAYFGYKRSSFSDLMKKKIKKIKTEDGSSVVMVFKGIRVWSVSPKRSELILEEFNKSSKEDSIRNFNNFFIELIQAKLDKKDNLNVDTSIALCVTESEALQPLNEINKATIDYKILAEATLDYFAKELSFSGTKTPKITTYSTGSRSTIIYEEE